MTDTPLLDLSPSKHAQDGVAASDDKLYRWAVWRFWDLSRSYIVFVDLHPRAHADPRLEQRIEDWMERWERSADRTMWQAGGYVVVSLFARVAWNVGALRRLHNSGVDIASPRAAEACLVFSRNPAASLIVMLPEIDAAPDLREEHQALILNALAGLNKPMATVDPQTQMPREWP